MKRKLLLVAFALLFSVSAISNSQEIRKKDLRIVEKLYYLKDSDVPFTGKVSEGKDRLYYLNGKQDGKWISFYKNGNIKSIINWKDGKLNGKSIEYYKNGNLMGFSDAEGLKMYYDDGQLLMSSTYSTGETILYHENGNPMMEVLNDNVAIYNEDNERLFKAESGQMIDLGLTMKKLDDGTFEVLKGDKLVSTIDANGEITNYLYSTGEKMMTLSDVDALTEFFFKDGTTLMKQYADGKILINYKSGKPLYEVEENNWYIYDEDGNKITSENETVTDIKKVN